MEEGVCWLGSVTCWIFLGADSERSLTYNIFIWEFLWDQHPWKGEKEAGWAEGAVEL